MAMHWLYLFSLYVLRINILWDTCWWHGLWNALSSSFAPPLPTTITTSGSFGCDFSRAAERYSWPKELGRPLQRRRQKREMNPAYFRSECPVHTPSGLEIESQYVGNSFWISGWLANLHCPDCPQPPLPSWFSSENGQIKGLIESNQLSFFLPNVHERQRWFMLRSYDVQAPWSQAKLDMQRIDSFDDLLRETSSFWLFRFLNVSSWFFFCDTSRRFAYGFFREKNFACITSPGQNQELSSENALFSCLVDLGLTGKTVGIDQLTNLEICQKHKNVDMSDVYTFSTFTYTKCC